MQRFVSIFLMLVSIATLPVVSPLRAAPEMRVETVAVITATGRHLFAAEIADTEATKRQGLMARTHLAPDKGMLFDNGVDREMHMWMKNTLIALDMIFITKDGTVVKIAKDTVPHSQAIISSGVPVRAVFEVSAGIADSIGLKKGDRIDHPMFH